MGYGEDVVQLKNAYKRETIGSIEEGFFIKEKLYTFRKYSFLEEKVKVYLPSEFREMPIELAKNKYPSEQRPAVIYMDDTTVINFGFQILNAPMDVDQTIECRNTLKTICQKSFPANVFFETGEFELANAKVGWFDYKSHTVDGPLYNVMYCVPLGKSIVHGMFNCPFTMMENWKPVALAIMEHLEV